MIADLDDQFSQFDPAYVQKVIVPHLRVRIYQGERLSLPLIDPSLSKQNAMPDDLWGLMSETWKPRTEDGVVLFLQGLEKRGFYKAWRNAGRTIAANASTCRR